jgi:hypothetical protein
MNTLCGTCKHVPWIKVGGTGPCGFDATTVTRTEEGYHSEMGRPITSCGYFRPKDPILIATCTTEGLAKLTGKKQRTVRRHVPQIPGATKDRWGRWTIPLPVGVEYIEGRKPGRPKK